ncbi:MAG: D-glycero-alpha-D-manno-heptose-1,7-bisphosphate 7-phosphatase [Gammaproteobacteria bacterium]
MESSPALFLDRDGVINIDHGYVCRKEEFEFVEGIFELVAAAKRAGYLVVVVTNQAGIGRGYYTEADFNRLMEWVAEQFAERGGGIDKVYYCPDHPEHGIGNYKRHSEFRKPGPGMILQAAAELHIDLGRSLLVGDKPSDIQAGLEAGIGTLLKLGAELGFDSAKMISSVSEAINYL